MPVHKDKTIRLTSLTYDSPVIEDHTFINCEILGPVVVAPSGTSFKACTFNTVSWEAMFWPHSNGAMVGAVQLLNCRLEGCRLSGVGITAPAEYETQMKNGINN